MIPPPDGIPVRIELSQSSQEFLESLAELMAAIAHADDAMLETTVATAAERMREALTSPDALIARRTDVPDRETTDWYDGCTCDSCQLHRAMTGGQMLVVAVKLERVRQVARVAALCAAGLLLARPWRR